MIKNIELTKPAIAIIGGLLLIGFIGIGAGQYKTQQDIAQLHPIETIIPTAIVSPTNVPTATPSATVKKVFTPAAKGAK